MPFADRPTLRTGVPSTRTPDESIGTPLSVSRHLPIRSKFSSENPIGSMILWQEAQTGCVRCNSSRSRSVLGFFAFGSASRFTSTPGGGSGGGAPRRFCRTHLPRITGDVRVAMERDCQKAPLAEKSTTRAGLVQGNPAEVVPSDSGDSVVPREPFVDECVVGVEHGQNAAIFSDDAIEEQFGFAAESLPKIVVEFFRDRSH